MEWPIGTTCCLLATCAHNQAVSDQHLEPMMIFVDTAASLVIYHITFMANLARDFLHNAHMKEDTLSFVQRETSGRFSI